MPTPANATPTQELTNHSGQQSHIRSGVGSDSIIPAPQVVPDEKLQLLYKLRSMQVHAETSAVLEAWRTGLTYHDQHQTYHRSFRDKPGLSQAFSTSQRPSYHENSIECLSTKTFTVLLSMLALSVSLRYPQLHDGQVRAWCSTAAGLPAV